MQAGLKTGMYYLRTRAAADAIKFTVDQQALAKNKALRASKLAVAVPLVATTPAALKVRTAFFCGPGPVRVFGVISTSQ